MHRAPFFLRFTLLSLLALLTLPARAGAPRFNDIDLPPHNYKERPLTDRFTQLKADLESGKLALDHASEKAALLSLLHALEIPASSQMLVFSTTSLQLSLITPQNPRAIFFNEDISLGYIPGGKIEVVSLDPELGAIFYIFDIPRDPRPPRIERSERCMKCHATDATAGVPGILIKSVVPGPTGGSLNAFRIDQSGHQIPLTDRFGGWYLTGQPNFTNHWGNLIGRFTPQGLQKNPIIPGRVFSFARYAVATSDILPQLVHEHQAGFANRVIEATYRARTHLHNSNGKLTAEQARELDDQARILTRYLLFADEAALPAGGITGDPAFKADFLRQRRAAPDGTSLKDFDLRTRLFKHRCSYMIYSRIFQGLPAEMKSRVYERLRSALDPKQPDADFAYLPAAEKQTIKAILRATLKELPASW